MHFLLLQIYYQNRMKLNLLFGGIILVSLGISTVRANAVECNSMFEAVVEMRGNLTEFLEGDQVKVQKVKKLVFYWTNVNVEDDIQLRQRVCQAVDANSIDKMAAAFRVPRTHFKNMYNGVKSFTLRYKMRIEEMFLLLPETLSDRRRQAMRAYVNVMNVAESVGLLRFDPPPPSSRHPQSGCSTMKQLGLRLYNDRQMFFNNPSAQSGKDSFRVATGIDIDDRDHISTILCKLGEVSDLTELAAVFNQPVIFVRQFYPMIVTQIRGLEKLIGSGKVPPGIPEHVPRNMLNFLRGMKEVGLLDLTG